MLAVRREQTASATIETRTPRPSRSSAVSSTHTCASTPVRITGAASSSRSRSAKPAAPHAENAVFSRAGASSRSTRSSGSVRPNPLGYCSVTTTGAARRRAVASRIFRLRTISSRRSASIAPNRRSCTSVTTKTGCGMAGPPGAETAAYCATTRRRLRRRAPLGGGPSVLAHQPGDGGDEIGRLERFGHVQLEPCREGSRSVFGPRVGRHGKGRHRAPVFPLPLPELLNEHVAVVTWKADVADQNVGTPLFHLLEGLLRVGGRRDIGAGGTQDHAHQLARVGLVIDDEDAEAPQADRPGDGLAVVSVARRHRRDLAAHGRGHREVDREDRPATLPRALGTHDTAVELDDVAHDREAEPEAAVSAADRCLALPEAVEHEREELRSNALACIADPDARRRVGALQSDIDAAAHRREDRKSTRLNSSH